ncbi:MAG TPA: alpha-glucuronidase [Mycobacteriales bacterium]|nr:alpha-glucuronidase [Mycobacteriales bacterium]
MGGSDHRRCGIATYFAGTDSCWLRVANLAALAGRTVSVLGDGPIAATLAAESARATGSTGLVSTGQVAAGSALIIARRDLLGGDELSRAAREGAARLGPEGFALVGDGRTAVITAGTERGLLYGYFHAVRLGAALWGDLVVVQEPAQPIRMVNNWDNMSAGEHLGSVERGYAGDSIFFRDGAVVPDRGRIADYARLLASVGVNALSINNVNVHPAAARLLTDHLDDVADLARILRGFGIALFLSVNFAAPVLLGGLPTADPAEPAVIAWWRDATERVYQRIPDFGGYLVKADSEGQPGPFSYGRDHADGANLLAGALRPFGGTVFWRCFVYNSRQDWRDRTTDRARAAYDNFMPIDGRFADNVVLQVKYGPVDFQVREPVSPLIPGLRATNIAVEFQLTQEYTGHQIDVCYLVPQWKQVLDFAADADGAEPVSTILATRARAHGRAGLCGVANIGADPNWTGHKLAQANLYGFGRLAWDPGLPADEVLAEWIRLTFPGSPRVHAVVGDILRDSWSVYESYTAPLGVGWMVTPEVHYGPSVDGYEYSRWGTYHFADRDGLGVDRTVATGSGFAGQYPPDRARQYEALETCPDELLLFFHHVPYTHLLRSGKSVIQHIYDSHFAGYERVAAMLAGWRGLAGQLDEVAYRNVLDRLERQLDSAREWRDQINTYFCRKSGIPDAHGRVIY